MKRAIQIWRPLEFLKMKVWIAQIGFGKMQKSQPRVSIINPFFEPKIDDICRLLFHRFISVCSNALIESAELNWSVDRERKMRKRNESAPIQLVLIYFFSNKIHGNNFLKQHSGTVMVWNYQNAVCSLLLKKKNTLAFIVIFGTLSFPIGCGC